MFKAELRAVLILGCVLAGSPTAVAADAAKPESNSRVPGYYCGLYCLYAAMQSIDKPVEFRSLIRPEYLGSKEGSTISELIRACQDHGVHAVGMAGMTTGMLRESPYPIVLHVKSEPDSREYDHYVLFLGQSNGQARIFNPPVPIQLMSFAELATRWDGVALVVSAVPADTSVLWRPVRNRLLLTIALAAGLVAAIHALRRKWRPASSPTSRPRWAVGTLVQFGALAIAAGAAGVTWHALNDEGLLARPDATAALARAHLAELTPKVSKSKVRRLLKTGVVFVDARLQPDYADGHLDGAINVPVNSTDEQRRKAMAGVSRDAEVVVYCQSSGCKFAEKVTRRLLDEGFTRVSIFRGGWREWTAGT